MKPWIERLKEARVEHIFPDEPLANHTTWRVGGPADVLIEPKNKGELVRSLKIVSEYGVPWRAIGRGSNLLVRDQGIRGAVFKLSKGFSDLQRHGSYIHVGGGFSFVRLATLISREGLSGLEFAGGIPGTVGGAVYMNAGAHGSDVSRIVSSAEILWDDGELLILNNEELQFAYRTSVLQKRRGIITKAAFKLDSGDRQQIVSAMAHYKDRRRRTQPLKMACAGSVFRNPEGNHAGNLIESAGLKGYRIGDAQVSERHANFIVNLNRATASDILHLMDHIRHTIQEKYQIELVPEVQVVGEG